MPITVQKQRKGKGSRRADLERRRELEELVLLALELRARLVELQPQLALHLRALRELRLHLTKVVLAFAYTVQIFTCTLYSI